jgi:amino acid adenylation domain-containing protein
MNMHNTNKQLGDLNLADMDIDALASLLQAADRKESESLPGQVETKVIVPQLTAAVTNEPVLSLAQERLWFMDRLAPGSPFYNIPFALRIDGPLDMAALGQAWREVILRHEQLRACFPAGENGQPTVAFLAPERLNLPVREQTGEKREEELRLALEREAATSLDVARGPLIRACVYRHGATHHTLVFTVHHIIFDGWSLPVFLNDLLAAYAAGRQGRAPEFSPLKTSYFQFAAWHRQLVASLADEESVWWREHLANLPDLEPPTDFPRPAVQSFAGGGSSLHIDLTARLGIEALAAEAGATPFAAWLTVFCLAVSRICAQDDFAVGSSYAARIHPATENLVGFFVENLCIRTALAAETSLVENISRMQAAVLEAIKHGCLPFQHLAGALGRPRDLSRNLIYQTAFTYQNMPAATEGEVEGLVFSPLAVPVKATHMDLEILAWPSANGLDCQILYATDIFQPESIREFAGLFGELVQAAARPESAAQPAGRLGLNVQPSLLRGAPRSHATLQPWQRFAELCEKNPEATALLAAGPDGLEAEPITRNKLCGQAEAIARRLRERGLGRGSLVLLSLEPGPVMLAAMLAVWRMGWAWITVSTKYPAALMRWIRADSGAALVLTEPGLWKGDEADASVIVLPDDSRALAMEEFFGGGEPQALLGTETACILYTSGSTGRPKGVPISHAALSNRLGWMWERYPWQPEEVGCQKTSPVFVDFLWETFGALLGGIPLLCLSSETVTDIPRLVDLLERHKVTRLVLVPSLLTEMHRLPGGLTGRLPALRFLTSSGEALTPGLAVETFKTLPSVTLLNLYGSTELTADATWHELRRAEGGPVPVGKPIHNTAAAILDDRGSLLPRGAVGKLYVAGSCLASGYHGAAAAFSEAWLGPGLPPGFMPEAWDELVRLSGRARWFSTGDLARCDVSGRIYHCGRADRQIKIRGVRIEPEEIQAVLEGHPLVREARVFGLRVRDEESQQAAETDKKLVAYLIAADQEPAMKNDTALSVEQWERLYDSMYATVRGQGDILDNFLIWESSYTGGPIPPKEMREWLNSVLAELRALTPKRILEVGCGQGFILMNLAQSCEVYAGIDVSEEALACLGDLTASPEIKIKARLYLEKADAVNLPTLDRLGGERFDLAVFNSVVQYFPDADYCRRAVAAALDLVETGGRIYLGDLRNHGTLDLFHMAVQSHRGEPDASALSVLDLVNAKKRLEGELLLAPAFWINLAGELPRIAHVEIKPKRGFSDNELTEFRYEVLLHCDRHPYSDFAGEVRAWSGLSGPDELDPALAALVQKPERDALAVATIPYSRLVPYRIMSALAEESCLSETPLTLERLRREMERGLASATPADCGLNPEEIYALAEGHGLRAHITLDVNDSAFLNVIFHHPGSRPLTGVRWPARDGGGLGLQALANTPARARDEAARRAVLRDYMNQKLPPAMVPDIMVTMPDWPRTPSGKIDWKRLPNPSLRVFAGGGEIQRPASRREISLADIWKLVIGIDELSVHDNFFEIGGTSLLLTQVHQMLQEASGRTFPLAVLFQYPTIHGLAAWLEKEPSSPLKQPERTSSRLEHINRQRTARARHLFPGPEEGTVK